MPVWGSPNGWRARHEAADQNVAEVRGVLGEVAAMRTIVATMNGRVANILEICQEADALLPAERGMLHGLVKSSLGCAYLMNGEVAAAQRALTEAIETQTEAGNTLLSYRWRYFLAIAESRRSNLHRAAEILQEGLQLVRMESGAYLPIAGESHLALAGLLYEWNELDEALAHLQQGMDLSQGWRVQGALNEGYITLARLQRARGDDAAALEAVEQITRCCGFFGKSFTTHIAVADLRAWARAGYLTHEIAVAEDLATRRQSSQTLTYEKLQTLNAAAHYLLAAGKPDLAGRLLEYIFPQVEAAGRNRELLEMLVLRVLAHAALGESGEARLALARGLALAEPEGYVRLFVDEGACMVELFQQADVRRVAPRYTGRLLAAFDRTSPAGCNARVALPVGHLSDRELEVLRTIAAGLSTAETARQLVVTQGTLRNHLKSIYAKLGVHTRLQAVQAARGLELI